MNDECDLEHMFHRNEAYCKTHQTLEINCLRRQLDQWKRREDLAQVNVAALLQERATLAEQIENWKGYVALLQKELESAIGMAWIHGWRSTPEKIERGNELRKKLGIPEASDSEKR